MPIPSPLLPVAPHAVAALSADDIAARLERWSALYEKAMRPATVRAVKGDWKTYATWCATTGHVPLGIAPDALIAFLRNGVDRGLRRATLDRYLFTIRLAHRAAGLSDPTLHGDSRTEVGHYDQRSSGAALEAGKAVEIAGTICEALRAVEVFQPPVAVAQDRRILA